MESGTTNQKSVIQKGEKNEKQIIKDKKDGNGVKNSQQKDIGKVKKKGNAVGKNTNKKKPNKKKKAEGKEQ